MTSPYKTYAVTLVAREHVSPSFVRITLAGDDTALLIMRDTESALDFTEEIKEMLR